MFSFGRKRSLSLWRRTAFLALVLLGAVAAFADPPYDELKDANGEIRPHYREVYKIYSEQKKAEKAEFAEATLKEFKGDNALDPLPRIIRQSEFDTLKQGAIQRARMYQKLIQDHYSGKKTYQSVMPSSVVQRALGRAGESGYQNGPFPKEISVPNGSDEIRGPDGKFYELEANPGYYGGQGDLRQARKSMFKHIPEYRNVIPDELIGTEYHESIMKEARVGAIPRRGKIVFFTPYGFSDNEDYRLRKIYEELGATIVTPTGDHRLIVTAEGVFTQNADGARHDRVGYVIMNMEHKYVDATHPAARESLLVSEASELLGRDRLTKGERELLLEALATDSKTGRINADLLEQAMMQIEGGMDEVRRVERTGVPGLVDAMLSGKVGTNYTPGVDFIGDKELHTYSEDLIRHYLREKPILRNAESYRLVTRGPKSELMLDRKLLKKLLDGDNYKNYVFKIVDGRGGDGVWIGPKMTKRDAHRVRKLIEARPEVFIAQKFTPLSVLDGKIVDLRMVTQIGPNQVIVSSAPWGRGTPVDGDGKVNLSQHGREFTIFVVPDDFGIDEAGCVKSGIAKIAHD